METRISNDGSYIKLVVGDLPLLISKAHIRTIDTVRDECVRLNIGEGAIRHIYIRYADVTLPAGLADVFALRDAVKGMADTGGIVGGGGGSECCEGLLEATQNNGLAITNGLNNVKNSADNVAAQVGLAKDAQLLSLAAVNDSVNNVGIQVIASKDAQLLSLSTLNSSVGAVVTKINDTAATQMAALNPIKVNVQALATAGANHTLQLTDLIAIGNNQVNLLTNIIQQLTQANTTLIEIRGPIG